MPIDNCYTFKLHKKEFISILSENFISKVEINKPMRADKDKYLLLFYVFFKVDPEDRNSGWIELWTDGTFRLQPKLIQDNVWTWKHHLDDQRRFDATVAKYDIINKLTNWSKTKESTYEIRPPPVYPPTYQRPTSKGQKWIKNKWIKNKETS